ncbi:MAG TPA: DUF5995 family protein [Paludibaculum sp.]|jgi:hypothetical protein
MPAATSIDQVLDQLDAIIVTCRRRSSRLGYFAALYRRVTAKVKQAIAAGRFENGPRMECMDVIFANRYIDAFHSWGASRPVTGAWRAAFEAESRWEPIILQHLLAGMKAHINLDLGIAAAECAPGDAISKLAGDFQRINDLLFELTQKAEDEISVVSPWIGLLDTVGGRTEDAVVEFSIAKARALAWNTALDLAPMSPVEREAYIARLDNFVETLGRLVLRPPPMTRAGLLVIRMRETSDARRVLDMLTEQ